MEKSGKKRTIKQTPTKTTDFISSLGIGDDILIEENIEDDTPDEIEEIDDETGNGVRESDKNESENEFG